MYDRLILDLRRYGLDLIGSYFQVCREKSEFWFIDIPYFRIGDLAWHISEQVTILFTLPKIYRFHST